MIDTPIWNFLNEYQKSGTARFHMPGHKGVDFIGCEHLDLTEIQGADSLYEADGIIARSEENASELFGSGRTVYSTEGSSQCIRAMLYLALNNRPMGTPCSNDEVAIRPPRKQSYAYGFEPEWLHILLCHVLDKVAKLPNKPEHDLLNTLHTMVSKKHHQQHDRHHHTHRHQYHRQNEHHEHDHHHHRNHHH